MTNEQIALLEFCLVGGTGLLLLLLGVILNVLQKRKIRRCSRRTTGHVAEYHFHGEGRVCPAVEFCAAGQTFRILRRFRGYVTTKKVSPGHLCSDSGAFVSDRDYLHVPMSAVTDLRKMAEELWPIGSEMAVYYDPEDPKRAFAEKLPEKTSSSAGIALIWAGIGVMILAVIMMLVTG